MDCSFIFMLKTSNLEFVYVSESIADVLGFEQEDILGRRLIEFLYPEEEDNVTRTLSATVRENKVASLVYLQLLHIEGRFETCVMANSVANNVIVGTISLASLETAGATARDASSEEVVVITESAEFSGGARRGPAATNWTGSRLPRTALLLDRFSAECIITHCTNGAILNPETCVQQQGGFFRYVAERDEALVKSFIWSLKRSGIEADAPSNIGFAYLTFTMCVTGRDLRSSPRSAHASTNGSDEVQVNVLGSASSDGLVLVVKRDI